MKILFDCATFYHKSCEQHGTNPRCVEFVKDIFERIAHVYKGRHEIHFSTMHDRLIHTCDFIPDAVFTWNDYDKEIRRRISYFKQHGCKVIYAEKAWLPSDAEHFYFDLQGINYYSSLTSWRFSRGLNDDEQECLDKYLAEYRRAESVAGEYVLLPLQVEFDTQIVIHSPFKAMQPLIDYVAATMPDKKIKVKPHPSDKLDAKSLTMPKNCELIYGDMHELISKCEYMVTINSTAGIEALTYYKPVMVLGNAFYANPLFTRPVKWACRAARTMGYPRAPEAERVQAQQKQVRAAGESATPPVKEAVDAFLYYLIFRRQWNLEDLKDEKLVNGLLDGRVSK